MKCNVMKAKRGLIICLEPQNSSGSTLIMVVLMGFTHSLDIENHQDLGASMKDSKTPVADSLLW